MTIEASGPLSSASGTVVTYNEAAAWDAVVVNLGGQPFQAWAWGELKSRFGWQPYRIASADRGSALQMLVRPYRGLAVAYVPRGPVAGEVPADPQLIAHAVQIARRHRAAFIRLEPDAEEGDPRAADIDRQLRDMRFRTSQRTLQPRSTIRLDLSPTQDQLLAGFSKGHRADIRRAERDGVTVRAGDASDVDVLYAMLVATRQRKDFGFHSAGYWQALMSAFGEAARIFVAELAGQPIGASLVIAWGSYGIYLAAGSNAAGLEHRAAHLLQWHAIRWAKERGAATWDLWGIADARGQHELAARSDKAAPAELDALDASARKDPLDGVYRFKKGWGGDVSRSLPAYDRVFIPPAYWLWQWRRGEA